MGKGFEENDQRDHIFFAYRRQDGRLTRRRTKLSHGSAGSDVSDSLLSLMAKQLGLSKADFLKLVDCPMSREEYENVSGD